MRNRERLLAALVCAMFLGTLSGCFRGTRFLGPNNPIDSSGILDEFRDELSSGGFREQVRVYFGSEEEAVRRAARDRIITGLILLVDNEYEYFATRMLSTRAFTNTALDTSAAGLALAATIVDHTNTASLLSGLGAGVLGLRLSIDKEFFYEQSSPILVAQMNQDRRSAYTDLEAGMKKSTQEYPLGMAARDLGAYYQAGTLVNAFAQVARTVNGGSATPGLTAIPRLKAEVALEGGEIEVAVDFVNKSIIGRSVNLEVTRFSSEEGRATDLIDRRLTVVEVGASGQASGTIRMPFDEKVQLIRVAAPTSTPLDLSGEVLPKPDPKPPADPGVER